MTLARVIIDTMVGEDMEKDIDAEIKRDVLELKKEIKKDAKAEKKEKPDIIFLLLERCIDTILLEEVTKVGFEDEPVQSLAGQDYFRVR